MEDPNGNDVRDSGVIASAGENDDGFELRGQWNNNTHYSWFEFPSDNRSKLEIWGYTSKTSYRPDEYVELHVSTTAASWGYEIFRDGAREEVVLRREGLTGELHPTANDAYRRGAGWPVGERIRIPGEWRSGGYVVVFSVSGPDGTSVEQEAFFILQPGKPKKGGIAFVVATGTWQAYNDWGGSNFYEGVGGEFSPETSTQRPWSRGMIRLPEGAPRVPVDGEVPIGAPPRYAALEFAYARGYCKYYMAAGWASFDRLFCRWAESNGYDLDYYAQDDLHRNQDLLDGYGCVVMVGHDEYHTREERMALNNYVNNGGYFVRLGGNVIWQARREGDSYVCYKYRAEQEDPAGKEPGREHLLSTAWESQALNWPPAGTWGVNGLRGIYIKVGGAMPRSTGGYTVYRPRHWALENTDLYYGDVFGAGANIAAYEGDGVTYTFRHGLPFATGEDGGSEDMEIVAMALAATEEEDHANPRTYLYVADGDLSFAAEAIYGEDNEENRSKVRYGSSMVFSLKKGKGEIFGAATTEWVNGLKMRDPFVEQITRNVLNRNAARG